MLKTELFSEYSIRYIFILYSYKVFLEFAKQQLEEGQEEDENHQKAVITAKKSLGRQVSGDNTSSPVQQASGGGNSSRNQALVSDVPRSTSPNARSDMFTEL